MQNDTPAAHIASEKWDSSAIEAVLEAGEIPLLIDQMCIRDSLNPMYQTGYAAYMGFFISIHVSAAKPAFSIVSG